MFLAFDIKTPFSDAGYDVRDYYTIVPRYGTDEDANRPTVQAEMAREDSLYHEVKKLMVEALQSETSVTFLYAEVVDGQVKAPGVSVTFLHCNRVELLFAGRKAESMEESRRNGYVRKKGTDNVCQSIYWCIAGNGGLWSGSDSDHIRQQYDALFDSWTGSNFIS